MLIWKYLIIRWKKQEIKEKEEVKGLTLTCNGICLFSDGKKINFDTNIAAACIPGKDKVFFFTLHHILKGFPFQD